MRPRCSHTAETSLFANKICFLIKEESSFTQGNILPLDAHCGQSRSYILDLIIWAWSCRDAEPFVLLPAFSDTGRLGGPSGVRFVEDASSTLQEQTGSVPPYRKDMA